MAQDMLMSVQHTRKVLSVMLFNLIKKKEEATWPQRTPSNLKKP